MNLHQPRAAYAPTEELIPSVSIPEGEKGDAKITTFEVTKEDAQMFNLGLARNGQGRRAIHPGKYTRINANGELQMTDTPAEKRDHYAVVRAAKGECLVMGLGLGMVANAMAMKPEVESVTVIEVNQNVIDLVAPTVHEKVTIICADALEWMPPAGQKWDVIWHDIWPTICLDDRDSRNKLKRRYARRWRVFHGAWADDEIARLAKAEYS